MSRFSIEISATADEETGGRMGMGWLINTHPNIFKNVGFVLTEGGSGRIINQKLVFEIEVTQKVPVWLKLSSFGNPGHASSPQVSSSITKLIDALNYLKENPFPPRVISSVEDYFYGLSDIVDTNLKLSGYLPKKFSLTYFPFLALKAWYSPSTVSFIIFTKCPVLSFARRGSQ